MDLEKHEELLKETQKQYPDIVLDGAVDNASWSKEKNRVLWVLKELNEFPKSNDLRSLLRQVANDLEPKKIYLNWQSSHGLHIKVSCQFLGSNNQTDRSILNRIAIIAVNKDASVSKSSYNELLEAGKKFRAIVLRQIELLDPTIVILEDTLHYLFDR